MTTPPPRYRMDAAVSLDRISQAALLGGLMMLCVVLFVSHLGINGELLSYGPYELNWGAGPGPAYLLNGKPVHFEGLPNLRNTAFFAGANHLLDLGYTIPTGRLLIPFLAGLLNLFTHDVVNSLAAVNLLFWIGGAWAAYGIGCRVLESRWMGLVMGVLLATSMGFVSNPVDIKVHLTSYAWFVIAIYLIHRLGFFDRAAPLSHVWTAGIVTAFGMFINGTHLMVLGYIGLMGLFRVSWPRLAIPFAMTGLFTAITKLVYEIALQSKIHVGTMEQIIIGNLKRHLFQTVEWLKGKPVDFEISSPSGYYHYTDLVSPFNDAITNLPSFFLMSGLPLAILAILGLLRPRGRELAMAVALALSGWVVVTLICTYWPWRNFFGYMHYYSVAGWYVLGAAGTLNLSDWIGGAARRLGVSEAGSAKAMLGSVGVVFAAVLLYANQDILLGHLIEHLHFHRTIFVPYPWDWDFNVTKW